MTIKDYVDSNFVEIDESYRGKSYLQANCYRKHFDNNHMKYDWITINDIDEFIFLEKGSGYINIQHFLDEPIFNDTDNIVLTWKYYDDNDILDVVDGNYNVQQRFTRHIPNKNDQNCYSKSIYKGKVERNYIIGGHCIQGFEDSSGRKYVFRTADGNIMKFKDIGWCFYNFNKTLKSARKVALISFRFYYSRPAVPAFILARKASFVLLFFILSRISSVISTSSIGFRTLRRIQIF